MTNPETYDKLSKSSGNRHEKNMGVFPSGQWGQTVNLLLFSFGGSNPPAPTKNSSVVKMLEFFFCPKLFKAYPRVDSNSCGAVAEDSAKTAQWAVFSSAACVIHPRPPRTPAS